ncbi:MAG: HyaD/HybD family hydrogenase maturation endopeptidase [Micrococcales bacterium]|nr:HyaD/HybD family hydrogenase maturation endopeptidase [Micrococcales bacterium]
MSETLESPAPITVLGVGNPIMGDDAVGLLLLERLRQQQPDPRVEYVDGGTGGMELVPVVQDAARLLILDAVAGDEPGTVHQFSGDQLPRMLSSKLSPHQVGLLDVFAAARMLGREPEQVEVVGVVPESVDLCLGVSEPVSEAMDRAVGAALDVIDSWLVEISEQS